MEDAFDCGELVGEKVDQISNQAKIVAVEFCKLKLVEMLAVERYVSKEGKTTGHGIAFGSV
jgi:hypothetical protein